MIERANTSFYIHTFGCQMNQADTEIMTALLESDGYRAASSEESAGIILLNTCAVREHAVERIGHYLQQLGGRKRKQKDLLVGVVGCIPQYQREAMFSLYPVIDFLAGPDTYRSLTALIGNAVRGARLAHLDYDHTETYAGITPVRSGSISAFVPVMRGCNNSCAFCVVPFTRGRERSHSFGSILSEIRALAGKGYREITLLGQNVNSYRDPDTGRDFSQLLDAVSREAPATRIRFTTSHPKDISKELVETMASRPNICNHIHLPVQSGSTSMLLRMNRGHTIEEYREKTGMIREFLPGASISTDLIAGFSGETESDHRETLELMQDILFDSAFMFYYSPRPGTLADRTMSDDVPDAVKKRRLQEIIDLQNAISARLFTKEIGSVVEVLAESESRRSAAELMGRTDTNRVVVFGREQYCPGDLLKVRITGATSATLSGKALQEF